MKSDPQNLPAGKDLNEIFANNGKLRQQFLESPQATLESIQGLQPGELDGVDIRPVPVTPKTILITLPSKEGQLSDRELEAVSGGLFGRIGKVAGVFAQATVSSPVWVGLAINGNLTAKSHQKLSATNFKVAEKISGLDRLR